MTDPGSEAEQPAGTPVPLQLNLKVDGGVAPGPDGRPWPVIVVSWGFSNFSLMIPEDVIKNALELGIFNAALEKALRLSMTARGAVVQVATQEELSRLLGPNGGPLHR